MSIKKLSTKILKYSTPVNNNVSILEWLVNCSTDSFSTNKKHLSKNLSEELKKCFGSPNKSLKLEYLTKVWVVEYKSLIFNIFASKRGTSIEICDHDFNDIRTGTKEKEIIQFLEELHKLINS